MDKYDNYLLVKRIQQIFSTFIDSLFDNDQLEKFASSWLMVLIRISNRSSLKLSVVSSTKIKVLQLAKKNYVTGII